MAACSAKSHKEIARKFDEIVAFSEVADFLDNAGEALFERYVCTIAFAVAAHLEPEILIVELVLAVGTLPSNASAYKKWKMWPVTSNCDFVSHNMSTIQRICVIRAWSSMEDDCS